MAARWEMDLSPGISRVPRNCFGGEIVAITLIPLFPWPEPEIRPALE